MQRISLVAYRQNLVAPDVADALRQVEIRAAKVGDRKIILKGGSSIKWGSVASCHGPTECPPHLSLRPAGREIRIRLQISGITDINREREVQDLWGLVVPLGFTPWNRYPLAGPGDDVFHFLGPWQSLYDHICGEGRGEMAWSSVCAAAQSDVGHWEGKRELEHFVQAQLHRIGIPCGPVDGIIGQRTTSALRSLGVKGMALSEVAEYLKDVDKPKISKTGRKTGHLIVPDTSLSVVAYGGISTIRTSQGVALSIDGPGRLVVDMGCHGGTS